MDGLEKYYTKKEVANDCIDFVIKHIDPQQDTIIIEPSAGDGSFSNILFDMFKNVLAYDIAPDHPTIIQQNFLKLDIPNEWYAKIVHVIGNIPFGKQSSLAKKFIRYCSRFADTISFILPNSFKKEYMQIPFPNYFHLVSQMSIPPNSFRIPNGKIFNASCCFQIWEKNKKKPYRIYIKSRPIFFNFVSKDDNPDFSIQRVGIKSGSISREIKNKKISSNFFIQLNDDINPEVFYNKFQDIQFPLDNNICSRSINKNELSFFTNSLSL